MIKSFKILIQMQTVKFAPDFDYYDSVSLPGTPQKSRENTAMSFISEVVRFTRFVISNLCIVLKQATIL
jgi:hypothetical protein